MIVDDHTDMRRMLRTVISASVKKPAVIIECQSGEEAIEMYAEHNPDVVLMDLQLEDMNGFEAMEKLYEQDTNAKVVIVTGFDTPSFRKKAKELHAQDFICKDKLSDLHQLMQNFSTK